MYDRTRPDCQEYGCKNNAVGLGINGYWTCTIYSNSQGWRVVGNGHLGTLDVNNNKDHGIRPVITIPKLLINN